MPLYTYRCESCGIQFEKMQKFADKPLTRCPECRTGSVRRVLQPPAIVFKGSGWYSTDHRSPSGSSTLKKSGDKKADGEEKTETTPPKKDAKPKATSTED